MNVTINKSLGKGILCAIPSKSYFHRWIIVAMMSDTESIIRTKGDLILSNDIKATLNAVASLGGKYEIHQNFIKIFPLEKRKGKIEIDCLESGSTLRFLIPLSLVFYDEVTFKGSPRLIERGIKVYIELFKKQGIEIIQTKTSFTFKGHLKKDDFVIDASSSSQYATGLLFALPLLNGASLKLLGKKSSTSYIDITLDVLKHANIKVRKNDDVLFASGSYHLDEACVEGDWSNAAFLLAFKFLGHDIKIEGLNYQSLQGDMKALEYFKALDNGFTTIDINETIDLGPILFAFAALKHGARFIGTARLVIKESNRLDDMVLELKKLGIKCDVLSDDEVIIHKALKLNEATVSSHNDHRIAMALSVILTKTSGKIENANAVAKSYPKFFEDLKKLNIEVYFGEENE